MLPALALLGGVSQASSRTPYAMREPLRLGALIVPATVARYALVEIPIDAAGSYDDPFDPTQVHLDAKVTEPDGRTYSVPGYLDRPFRRRLDGDAERLEPDGPARWRLRISPEKEGAYHLKVTFADATGEKIENADFRCVASDDPGFVRVGEEDRRFFAFSNGKTLWPLGANLAWAGPRGTFDYDDWLAKLGDNGANYARLWLAPSWTTLAQELPGHPEEGKGVGQIDLANAWRLDHVLATARQKGVYAMLCLDSYGELKQTGLNAWWDHTPQNSDNGGPLRIWRDYWSSDVMDRLYRNRLRYLVARYGADSHVFGWEFWNESDRTTEFDAATVRDWHQRMARVLDGLDAYHHLRTTSLASTVGLRSIDLIPELDLVQSHSDGSSDPAGTVASQQSRKSGWGKPHFFGEIAASGEDPRADVDPDGMQVHDPIWASIATGASGGAAAFWWDRLIAAHDLFGLYGGASRFLKGVEWQDERFRQTDVALSPVDPKVPQPWGDLVLDNGPVAFVPGPGMAPQATVVSEGQLLGEAPAGILHGLVMHPELHNPLTLRVRVARPTRFIVGVSSVSGTGGANLRVAVDNTMALSRDFPDPDGNAKTDTLYNYAGAYTLTLTPGVHTLRIENTGADWVKVGYRFVGVVPRKGPPLNAWAVVGDGTIMAWVRVAGRTWRAVAEEKLAIAPAAPSVMRLRGLRSGMWRAEIWDTWAGRPLSTTRIRVGIDGGFRVGLPAIDRDVAVKAVRDGG